MNIKPYNWPESREKRLVPMARQRFGYFTWSLWVLRTGYVFRAFSAIALVSVSHFRSTRKR